MQIQKRSMNWVSKSSPWQEMEAARLKRRAYSQAALSTASAFSSSLISTANSTTDSVNLTMQIAVDRVRNGTTRKV
jgi:hypothetical protein